MKKNCKFVGLTGSIGSGKTVVANYFAELGVTVIDADECSHQALTLQVVKAEIRNLLGKEMLDSNGEIIRNKVKKIIFNNSELRKSYQDIIHPVIHQMIHSKMTLAKGIYAIVVMPLLFENRDKYDNLARIITLIIDRARQIAYIKSRDKMPEDLINKIIESQTTDCQRLSIASDTIDNSGTLDDLRVRVNELHNHYLKIFAE